MALLKEQWGSRAGLVLAMVAPPDVFEINVTRFGSAGGAEIDAPHAPAAGHSLPDACVAAVPDIAAPADGHGQLIVHLVTAWKPPTVRPPQCPHRHSKGVAMESSVVL